MTAWRQRGLGTWLLVLAAAAALYATVIGWAGGFDVEAGPLRLRSRDAARPALLAGLAFITFLLVDHRRARRAMARAWGRVDTLAASRGLLALAVAWTLVAGVLFNSWAAGGADSYGYISQAALLRQGLLVDAVPFDPAFTWRHAAATMVPLGYVPTAAPDVMAPLYPPGLSLLMLPASLVHGSGTFLVVPLFGVLLITCVWLAGRQLGDPLAAGVSALLLAASPTFLHQVIQPMSDVPAAALWLAALVGLSRRGTGDLLSGLLVGLAILVRPNLAPLTPIVLLAGWWSARWDLRNAVRFALPVGACVLILFYVQWVRYGAPTASGYGPLSLLFSAESARVNVHQYPGWITAAYTPVIWTSVLALFVLPRTSRTLAAALTAFAAGNWLLYLPYVAFQPHEWHYTRFLLPAIAVMVLLSCGVVLHGIRRLLPEARIVIAGVMVLAVLVVMGRHVVDQRVFEVRDREQKYPAAGAAVVAQSGRGAWVLAAQHSGSLRLYAGAVTIRWDVVEPGDIDQVITILRARGRDPLLVVDAGEVDAFRERFAGSRAVATMALVRLAGGETRIYRFE